MAHSHPKSAESTQDTLPTVDSQQTLSTDCLYSFCTLSLGSAPIHHGEMDSPKSILYENPVGATSFSRFPSFMDSYEDSQLFFSRTRSFNEVSDPQDLFFGPLYGI